MPWLARRLLFYVFAIWVALTINFLLPRMMPGDPIAGLLAHLNPSQLAANPGLVQTYQALLGGGDNSIWQDYVTYLGRAVDNVMVPTFMALGAFPAFFTALLALYFLGLKAQWFPIQHAYETGLSPGFNWTFLSSAFRHSQLPILVVVATFTGGWVLNMRT